MEILLLSLLLVRMSRLQLSCPSLSPVLAIFLRITVVKLHNGCDNFVVHITVTQRAHNLANQLFIVTLSLSYRKWVGRDPARYRIEHNAVNPNLSFRFLGHNIPFCEPSSCSAGSAWSPAPFLNSGSLSGLDWEWPVEVKMIWPLAQQLNLLWYSIECKKRVC